MHGTEHRSQKRRAPRFLAPRPPFSPTTGSTPQSAPQPPSDRSWQLVTAFLSPATAGALTPSIPGSTFPACYFAPKPADSAARSAFSLHYPPRFAPEWAASSRQARCRFLDRPGWLLSYFHSPSGLLPPSGSKRSAVLLPAGSPSEPARSPFAPRRRFLSLVFRLRITVPGPLRFRRLAVPQTSWNLFHYAPDLVSRQRLLC